MLRSRIDAVEPDPQDASGEVLLHTFSEQLADRSWANICAPGPDGRGKVFPLRAARCRMGASSRRRAGSS